MKIYGAILQVALALVTIIAIVFGGWWLAWQWGLIGPPFWIREEPPPSLNGIRAAETPMVAPPNATNMPVGPGGRSSYEHWEATSTPLPPVCGSWGCNVDIPNSSFWPLLPGEKGVRITNGPLVVVHLESIRSYNERRVNPHWLGAFTYEEPIKEVIATVRMQARGAVDMSKLQFRLEDLDNDRLRVVVKIPPLALDSSGVSVVNSNNPIEIRWETNPDHNPDIVYWCDIQGLQIFTGTCDMLQAPEPEEWDRARTEAGTPGWMNDLIMGEVAAQEAALMTMRVIDESQALREQYKNAVLGTSPVTTTVTADGTVSFDQFEFDENGQMMTVGAHNYLHTYAVGVACLVRTGTGRTCDPAKWEIVFEVEDAPSHLSYINGNPFFVEEAVDELVRDWFSSQPTATP